MGGARGRARDEGRIPEFEVALARTGRLGGLPSGKPGLEIGAGKRAPGSRLHAAGGAGPPPEVLSHQEEPTRGTKPSVVGMLVATPFSYLSRLCSGARVIFPLETVSFSFSFIE